MKKPSVLPLFLGLALLLSIAARTFRVTVWGSRNGMAAVTSRAASSNFASKGKSRKDE